MARLKQWLIEWILSNPWLVRVCPRVFRLQLLFGKLYQFAGQNEIAYHAYCKAILGKPDAFEPYQLASKLSDGPQIKPTWISFLWQVSGQASSKNTIPVLFLLQDDVSLTADKRISLLLESVQRTGRASLIDMLVRELIKENRLVELANRNISRHVKALSVVQCLRLLDFALLASGEQAYYFLRKVFLDQVDMVIPEFSDPNKVLVSDHNGLHMITGYNEDDVPNIKQWLKMQYFTDELSDDALFQFGEQYKEWKPFCLELTIEKARFSGDKELLTQCVGRILGLDNKEIIDQKFNLAFLGGLLQKNNAFPLAVDLYKKMQTLYPENIQSLSQLASCYRAQGDLSKALAYANQEIKSTSGVISKRKVQIIESELHLLQTAKMKQVKEGERGNLGKTEINVGNEDGSVLHVLNNSFPHSGNGYAVRSKYIVDHQANLGLRPVVVTRLGFPTIGGNQKVDMEQVDGVLYYRLQRDIYSFSRQPVERYLNKYEENLKKVVRKVKPRVIHAASNFYNGYPALCTAQKLNVPFVYEVRGFWEMSKSSFIEGYERSEKYRIHHGMEFLVMEQSDHIVTISESLKKYIVERGMDPNKITVVPNAVDTCYFTPQPANEQLIDKYGLAGKTVIGFIGSITAYEGLDTLLRSVKKLNRSDVAVLIVGSGSALESLKDLTKQLNMESQVFFPGRVPFEEVKNYYSIIDIFPFPRVQSDVCELVTPLKPYEAMAMGKTVLVSKLAALKEMVQGGETGMYFNTGDADDLAEKLDFLMVNGDLRRKLAEKGREWVVKHRDWQDISQWYKPIYEQLNQVNRSVN